MSNPVQLEINDLRLHCRSFLIICTLIGKSDARYFIRNQLRKNSVETATTESNNYGVQSLIVRDRRALINCKVWGSTAFIDGINQNFHVGDIIRINNAVVSYRKNNEFEPNTSSEFLLTVTESSKCKDYISLLSYPLIFMKFV